MSIDRIAQVQGIVGQMSSVNRILACCRGGRIPHEEAGRAAVGLKPNSRATYAAGTKSANRIELSKGRDLVVEPGPASGAINFLAYPVLEVGGKPVKVKTEFSFHREARAKQQG